MILQALTAYYQTLEEAGKIAAPGWASVKVSFALCLGDNGALEHVISVRQSSPGAKRPPWPPGACPCQPR